MEEREGVHSVARIEKMIFQFAFQNRELSQKKEGINQQIKVCKAEVAERRSYIERTRTNITKLDKDIAEKRITIKQLKASAKSMEVTNSFLQEYEKALKAELERRQRSLDQDMKMFEERIASCTEVLQRHKDYYFRNPLAKKLLAIQADKEEIESRMKAFEDEITMKQEELKILLDPTVDPSSPEKQPESILVQPTVTDPEKKLNHPSEVDIDTSKYFSSLQLDQTKDVQKICFAGEEIPEETLETSTTHESSLSYPPAAEETGRELRSTQETVDKMQQSDQIPSADRDKGSEPEKQEERAASPLTGREVEDAMAERSTGEEEKALFAPNEGADKPGTAFPQPLPPRNKPKSPPGRIKTAWSTPTFLINSSPGSSPGRGACDGKSPGFLFSINSDPGTPSFTGFGFDMGSASQEDSPFAFPCSYFGDKKSNNSKSSGPGFPFHQTESAEGDFHFSFASKSPEATAPGQDKSTDEGFPFSFDFGGF